MSEEHRNGDPSDAPKINVGVDGDVQGELNVAGRDIVQQKTIIQRLPRGLLFGALAVLVFGCAMVVVVIAVSSGILGNKVNTVGTQVGDVNSGVSTLTAPTALPFPAATGNEVLIIVTDFTGESVDARIYNALKDRVAESGFTDVRVERLHGVAPETAEAAVAIGKVFNATLVIWGIADSVGIEPHYEVVSHRLVIKSTIDLGVTPALDQPSFSTYVVTGVPNEFEYLMLFSLGQIAYFNNDYDKSIGLFDQALSIDLGERQSQLKVELAYFYRGFAHDQNGDFEAAMADYSKAIDLNPNLLVAYNSRGLLAYNLGDSDAALADFSKAIELDANFGPAYGNRALVAINRGDLDAALADYTKSIELDPNDAVAYVNRSIVYRDKGDVETALAEVSKAIQLDPGYGFAYLNRGYLHELQGDLDAALADYSKDIELDPTDSYAYVIRGIVYDAQGNLDAALADHAKAIQIDPEYEYAYFSRGHLYYLHGDLDAALADFSKAIEIDPEDIFAYVSRANVYVSRGDLDAALADSDKAVKIEPESVYGYFARGAVYQLQGNQDAALADAEKAVELDPTNAQVYNNRGYTLAQQGRQLDKALDDLNHALELEPDQAAFWDSRAYVYYKLGRYDEGLSDASEAIRRGELFGYYTRGLIEQAQGKSAEAIADFTRFINEYPNKVPQKDDARQRITDLGGTPP